MSDDTALNFLIMMVPYGTPTPLALCTQCASPYNARQAVANTRSVTGVPADLCDLHIPTLLFAFLMSLTIELFGDERFLILILCMDKSLASSFTTVGFRFYVAIIAST